MSASGSGRRSLLVVSAHAGDPGWRAVGAIAPAVRSYPQVTEELA
jgi:hypothetical protein